MTIQFYLILPNAYLIFIFHYLLMTHFQLSWLILIRFSFSFHYSVMTSLKTRFAWEILASVAGKMLPHTLSSLFLSLLLYSILLFSYLFSLLLSFHILLNHILFFFFHLFFLIFICSTLSFPVILSWIFSSNIKSYPYVMYRYLVTVVHYFCRITSFLLFFLINFIIFSSSFLLFFNHFFYESSLFLSPFLINYTVLLDSQPTVLATVVRVQESERLMA